MEIENTPVLEVDAEENGAKEANQASEKVEKASDGFQECELPQLNEVEKEEAKSAKDDDITPTDQVAEPLDPTKLKQDGVE